MKGNFGAPTLAALCCAALYGSSAYSQAPGPVQTAPASPPAGSAPSNPARATTAPAAAPPASSGHKHAASPSPRRKKSSPYSAVAHSDRAANTYETTWGVNTLLVRSVPADQLIRFSYRVSDAAKAKVLNAKEAAPQLIDPESRVSLVVPTMDKIGQLRQSGPPENGKTYWMVFSNKGNVVKRGHRVSIVIGQFRADGLAVE